MWQHKKYKRTYKAEYYTVYEDCGLVYLQKKTRKFCLKAGNKEFNFSSPAEAKNKGWIKI